MNPSRNRSVRPLERDRVDDRSDETLLAGIGRGSEESFNVMFDRWAPRLGRFLAHSTRSPEEAEDLLQDAFLRVLRASSRFEPRAGVGPWLYRICANLAASHWRRQRAAPIASEDPGRYEAPRCDTTPESDATRLVFMHRARRAVDALPPEQRIAFLLKIDGDLTYEEISAAIGCPIGTAKSRFHHAVRKLRHALIDPDGGEQRERSR